MTIGERIKNERTKQGISQAALGEMLKITQQAVGRWERNLSEPDIRALNEMATIFNVTVDCLLGRETIVTSEDRTKGWVDSEMIRVIPIEAEMLEVFREVGAKRGKETQKALIAVAKNMCD